MSEATCYNVNELSESQSDTNINSAAGQNTAEELFPSAEIINAIEKIDGLFMDA